MDPGGPVISYLFLPISALLSGRTPVLVLMVKFFTVLSQLITHLLQLTCLICFYSTSLSRCCQLLTSLHLLQIYYWHII